MKQTLLAFSLCMLAAPALQAQITINTGDLPVLGDQLVYSISLPGAGLNLSNTGAGITWDYSNLTALAQGIDSYKTVTAAGYSASSGIGANAFGYKVSDSLGFSGAPVTLNNVYTFFSLKTGPSRFVAEGFGGKINNAIPIAAPYSDEDEWYFLPLTYNKYDSSSFKLTASVLGLGTLKMQGTRKTRVDGWGTIRTPYFTTPVNVLRVRSEVNEIDTITYMSQNFAIPRHYVDYKWMANNEHYPVLWITANMVGGNEVPSSVRYKDRRNVGIGGTSAAPVALSVYPNPASGNDVQVKVPATWNNFVLHIYDGSGRLLRSLSNTARVNTSELAAGRYFIMAESNGVIGAAQFVK